MKAYLDRLMRVKESSLPVTLLWCAVIFLLIVPYVTGFVSYQNAHGQFPISIPSAAYALALCVLVAFRAVFKKPILPGSSILLLLVLVCRVADAVLLTRAPEAMEWDPKSFFGFGVIFSAALLGAYGDRRIVKWAAGLCALSTLVIVCSLNIWEWGYPGYFSTVVGRSAGWLENSNDSSMAICLSMALLLVLRLPNWFNFMVVILATIGIYTTLSRGNILIWALTCAAALFVQSKRSYRTPILLLAAGCVAAYIIVQQFEFQAANESDVLARQLLLRGRGSVDLGNEERLDLLLRGIDGIIQNPVGGYGSGASMGFPFQPHNQILAVWLDNGIFVLIIYLAALARLVFECYRAGVFYMPLCVPLVAEVFFSHNLLETKMYLFVFITGAALAHHDYFQRRRVRVGTKVFRAEKKAAGSLPALAPV